MIRFGSVCSGIEAASVAWHPLGWRAAWLAEIEPFPCAVLANHYPDVRNIGDMTQLPEMIRAGEVEAPDVFTGGTPCQAFSVAGKRGSLADARGNLSLTFVEIANAVDDVRTADGREPCVVVWENVPGVLSTADNAFGCFLGALAGSDDAVQPAGEGWANAGLVLGPRRAVCWRILDAQFFGLAQRRRRVFVVASAREGFDPAAVLLEFDGVRRDSAPRRETREEAAGGAGSGAASGVDFQNCAATGDVCGTLMGEAQAKAGEAGHGVFAPALARCVTEGEGSRQDYETCTMVAHTLRGEGFDASEDGSMGHDGSHANGGGQVAIAFGISSDAIDRSGEGDGSAAQRAGLGIVEEQSPTLRARPNNSVAAGMAVRRLTPRECERLQGFPEVIDRITLSVCFDRQNGSVVVALKCRRWQTDAWPVGADEWTPAAETAALGSSTRQADPAPLAAATVRLRCGDDLLALRNHGRLLWCASAAEKSERFPLSTPPADTARALAQPALELALAVRAGKAGSQASIKLSLPVADGSKHAAPSGDGTADYAAAAANVQKPATFTTFDLGRLRPTSGTTTETWCCSVLAAIAGCIPSETLPENFSVELTVGAPYTAIPWRGKAAALCPDGPRYKALGNSWAVPCARWIGERIDVALRMLERKLEAA